MTVKNNIDVVIFSPNLRNLIITNNKITIFYFFKFLIKNCNRYKVVCFHFFLI